MSNSNLDTAISDLPQSPDQKSDLKILISIRSKLEGCNDKNNIASRDIECCKQITKILLNTTQKQCVDEALSILENCLIARIPTSKMVDQHNILSVLNQLLEKYPKEDSINGTTFRIVKNMCQICGRWATIIVDRNPLIVSHITEIVLKASRDQLQEGEKISEATIITALQSLRELLNFDTERTLIKKFGVLKAIGALFIKYSEQWQKNKQNENMLLDIVKVIQQYSTFRCNSYIPVIEMKNTERGDLLIYLSSVLMLAPKRIVKIVMSFIQSPQQSELRIPEICNNFVEAQEKHSIIKDFEGHCTEYLQCLCYLLEQSLCRNYDLCYRAVPLLIKFLKEVEEMSSTTVVCCTYIICTLSNFKYDVRLIRRQLTLGIIQVLTDKLACLVGPPDVLHFKHIVERRICSCDATRIPSPCSSLDSESKVLSESKYNYHFPPFLPLDHVGDCQSNSPSPLPTVPVLDDFIETNMEEDNAANIPSLLKYNLLQGIWDLLYTYIEQQHHPLLAGSLLIQLTKCALIGQELLYSSLLITKVICTTVRSQLYLLPLMPEYIQTLNEIQSMTPYHQLCPHSQQLNLFLHTVMQRFCNSAEYYFLDVYKKYKNNEDVMRKLVREFPYISNFRNRFSWNRLRFYRDGVDFLIKILQGNDEESNKSSLKMLHVMAYENNPTPMRKTPFLNRPKIVADKYQLSNSCNNLVTFEFDDGATVRADREFLIEKSEYFDGLLNGHFKESELSHVSLPNVNPKSFRCLLNLLENVDKIVLIEIDLDLKTLLDVIMLSDRFLLSGLCLSLMKYVVEFWIAMDTVPMIYNWSVESGLNLLRTECVTFALVADVEEGERYPMFLNLFNLGYRQQVFEDIKDAVEYQKLA